MPMHHMALLGLREGELPFVASPTYAGARRIYGLAEGTALCARLLWPVGELRGRISFPHMKEFQSEISF